MNSESMQTLQQKESESSKLYRFHYLDKHTVVRIFKTEKEMQWFALNEGDCLLKVEEI